MTERVDFEPTREAALDRLERFLPRAGRDYAKTRNYDFGPDDRSNVSVLSPWIRVRALSEAEVAAAVLDAHGYRPAEKFIQEVCWRTYWKGWLQLRPSIWQDYRRQVAEDRDRLGDDSRLRKALEGRTPIPSFNTWAHELVETGYVHNHARMWFASIWVFTLKLPWTLGADFLLRHLLDGDPASNTLSWRWVAGLQTRGKTYAARASNIANYTDGRLGAGERFAQPDGPVADPGPLPKPCPLDELPPAVTVAGRGRTGLLLTDEDLTPEQTGLDLAGLHAVAGLFPRKAYDHLGLADQVQSFRRACQRDALRRIAAATSTRQEPLRVEVDPIDDLDAIERWVADAELANVAMIEPCVGPWSTGLRQLRERLGARGVDLTLIRRDWDDALWPHATHGFFRFKKVLPELLPRLCEGAAPSSLEMSTKTGS